MILVLVLCKTLTPPLATDHLSSNCIDPSLKMFLYPLHCLLPNGTSAIKLSPLQLKSTFPQISPDDHVTQTWCTPKTVKVFLKVKCKCQIPDRTEAFRSYNCNEKCLFNQKYFPSRPNRISAAKPKIVPMVTIVKI